MSHSTVHFHTLVAAGVFATAPDGSVRFVPSPRPPTDREVSRLLATVRRRIARPARRHGLALAAARRRRAAAGAWWRPSPRPA